MTEYSITRRGKVEVRELCWVDNKLLSLDLEKLMNEIAAVVSSDHEYCVTLSVSVEDLGKKYEHVKREWVSDAEAAAQMNSVTAGRIYNPAPEVF